MLTKCDMKQSYWDRHGTGLASAVDDKLAGDVEYDDNGYEIEFPNN